MAQIMFCQCSDQSLKYVWYLKNVLKFLKQLPQQLVLLFIVLKQPRNGSNHVLSEFWPILILVWYYQKKCLNFETAATTAYIAAITVYYIKITYKRLRPCSVRFLSSPKILYYFYFFLNSETDITTDTTSSFDVYYVKTA